MVEKSFSFDERSIFVEKIGVTKSHYFPNLIRIRETLKECKKVTLKKKKKKKKKNKTSQPTFNLQIQESLHTGITLSVVTL